MPVWPECKTILGEWSWKQASRWMLASLKPIQPLLKIERCSARLSIAFRFSFSARSFAISSRLRETFSCSRIDSSAIISVVSMRRVAVFPFCGIRFFTPRRLVVIFCPTTDSSVIFDFGVGSGLIITRSASKALMAKSLGRPSAPLLSQFAVQFVALRAQPYCHLVQADQRQLAYAREFALHLLRLPAQ